MWCGASLITTNHAQRSSLFAQGMQASQCTAAKQTPHMYVISLCYYREKTGAVIREQNPHEKILSRGLLCQQFLSFLKFLIAQH